MDIETGFDPEEVSNRLLASFQTITEHAQITIQESGAGYKLTGNCWSITNGLGVPDSVLIAAKITANVGKNRISNISVTPEDSGWLFSADIRK